jgi:hypothetical protein
MISATTVSAAANFSGVTGMTSVESHAMNDVLDWLPDNAPAVLLHFMSRFPDTDEIVSAVRYGVDQGTVKCEPSKIEKLFDKGGAAIEIRINEYRKYLKAKAEREQRNREQRLAEQEAAADKKARDDKKAEDKRLGEKWNLDLSAVRDDLSVDFDEWLNTHPPVGTAIVNFDAQKLKSVVCERRSEIKLYRPMFYGDHRNSERPWQSHQCLPVWSPQVYL